MLELTGMGSVLRGIGILYWVLAIGAVSLAIWKGKNWQRKTFWAGLAIVAFGFLPAKAMIEQVQRNAYARKAWAHFKKLCEEKSGERIYKTYTGVKSVLVIKPLPPATEKDLYDQFWYGDPYSDATPWSRRAELAASRLAWSDGPISRTERGRGFDFVESPATGTNRVIRYYYPKEARDHLSQFADRPVSSVGISWEDISTSGDRKYWVAGGRLRVIDLADNSIIAERIGYLIEPSFGSTAGGRRPWLVSRGPNTTCPRVHDYADRWFLLKVLKPTEGTEYGK